MSDTAQFNRLLDEIREGAQANTSMIEKIVRSHEECRRQAAWLAGAEPVSPGQPNGHAR